MAAASSSAVSQVELTFELFPKLPMELQRMIWKEALPGPRLVFLERLFISAPLSRRVWSNVDVNDEDNMLFLSQDRRYQLRSKPATPKTTYIRVKSQSSKQLQSLLQASPESRLFVKESYQLAFGTEIHPPQTYFDFKRDTLLMYWEDLDEWHILDNPDRIYDPIFIGQDIRKVDRLALLASNYFLSEMYLYADYYSALNGVLDEFGNVKELTLVDDQLPRPLELWCEEDDSELVVMDDVVDIETSMEIFEESIKYTPELDRDLRDANIFQGSLLSNAVVDGDEFAALRSRSTWATYALPQVIEYKTLTTRRRKEQYEREKKLYDEKKAQYKVQIIVVSKGLPNWSAIFKASCTPADVAAAYRRSNYPRSGGKFFDVWDGTSADQLRPLDPNTSLIELDVRSCDILSIKFQEVQADSMALLADSDGEELNVRNSAEEEIVPQDADGWFPDLGI
jgi:hypothetical protein